jgi:hypothetical protein
MIKIELEFPTGAEARQALMELLGGTIQIESKPEISIKDEKITENFDALKTEEGQPRKRQTKAEKTLAAAKPAIEEQLGTTNIQDGPTIEQANEEESETKQPVSAITKEMLQEKAVNLIRNGKKAEVTETIKKFGADSISQADKNPVKPEDYAALMDAFNAIG